MRDLSDILAKIRAALVMVDPRYAHVALESTTSLVDDLELDSLHFVELAVAIERVFSIPDFPLQAWYDSESTRESRRYTLQSLALLCETLTHRG